MVSSKKILKCVFINILICLFLFFTLDIVVYYRHLYMSFRYNVSENNISYLGHITRKMNNNYIKKVMFEENEYPPVVKGSENLRPIVLFGGSFAQGAGLEENQKFSYLLSKQTGRTVINRAGGGWGTQHMLFQLRSSELYDIIKDETDNNIPEYIIYLFMEDHINRIHVAMEPILFGGYPTFVYRQNKGDLSLSPTAYFRFPLLAYVREFYYFNFVGIKSRAELLKQHILLSKKEIDKHYAKNINKPKFVLFLYDDNYEILSSAKDFNDNGIILIMAEQLMGETLHLDKYYISKYDNHPNKLVWEKLTPKFIDFLKNYDEKEKNETFDFISEKIKNEYSDVNTEQKFDFKNINSVREGCSGFSICVQDKENIQAGKVSASQAYFSYFLWSSENLLSEFGRNFITKKLLDFAMFVNPDNKVYEVYQEKYYEHH